MSQFNLRYSHCQRQEWRYPVTASWVPYHKYYVMRLFPSRGVKVLHPRAHDLTRSPAMTNHKKKRYPGCLTHVVSGMFYSVVANRRPPNLSIIHGGEGDVRLLLLPLVI